MRKSDYRILKVEERLDILLHVVVTPRAYQNVKCKQSCERPKFFKTRSAPPPDNLEPALGFLHYR